MLTKKIKADIIAHAIREYPRECCGVIVDKVYLPCVNIAADDAQFEINPVDLVSASEQGEIRAYVHSHPDGSCEPSIPDRIQMGLHGLPWVITNGIDTVSHEPKKFTAPLLGREYYHGLQDCYSLVKDYYERELDIILGDYERTDAWWESADSKPLYLDNFKKEGFIEVGNIKKHDLILCRLGRTEHINHALVFVDDGVLKSEQTDRVVGNGLVLHHPYNRQSVRELYGEQWQRRAAVVIRHKSLIK